MTIKIKKENYIKLFNNAIKELNLINKLDIENLKIYFKEYYKKNNIKIIII